MPDRRVQGILLIDQAPCRAAPVLVRVLAHPPLARPRFVRAVRILPADRQQNPFNRLADCRGQLVLQLKNILQIAVVVPRPGVLVIGGIDQLRTDMKAIASRPYFSVFNGVRKRVSPLTTAARYPAAVTALTGWLK